MEWAPRSVITGTGYQKDIIKHSKGSTVTVQVYARDTQHSDFHWQASKLATTPLINALSKQRQRPIEMSKGSNRPGSGVAREREPNCKLGEVPEAYPLLAVKLPYGIYNNMTQLAILKPEGNNQKDN